MHRRARCLMRRAAPAAAPNRLPGLLTIVGLRHRHRPPNIQRRHRCRLGPARQPKYGYCYDAPGAAPLPARFLQ
jgi:hypothetical protein